MAIIKTTDGDVKLFTNADPYRYDIDNRPLRELIQNDININNELAATTTEVTNARTDNATGTPVVYSTLDNRLEAMSLSSLGNSSVSYSIFQSQAEKTRALYPSGWVAQPTGIALNQIYAGDDWSGLFGTQWLNNNAPNQMYINNEYSGLYLPLSLFVNGWHIKLQNLQANGATPYGAHTAIKLPAPPSSGGRQDFVFLEVWLKEIADNNRRFWLYGSPQYNIGTLGVSEGTFVIDTNGSNGNYVADPLDARVVHSLTRLSNGNWLQVQHRVRVFSGVNPTANADGFTGTTGTSPAGNSEQVFAQGSQNAPVSSKPFSSMASIIADAGLYRAGAGVSDSAALGTYDGHSYAVPIAMVHRRNTDFFTLTNQNGCKLVGQASSGALSSTIKSGRPDGRSYDAIYRDDFLDMRHWVEPKGFEYERLMTRAFDEILSGSSREQWESLNYSGSAQPVYGNRLLTNDTIFDSTTYGSNPDYAVTVTNQVKDKSKAGTPQSNPDGVRQLFGATQTPQRFEFWVDPWANTSSHSFITFLTPAAGKKKIQLNLDALSGGGGTGGTKLRNTNDDGSSYVPSFRWQVDYSEISPTLAGTVTVPTFEWDVTTRTGADGRVYGNVDIIYPSKSGALRLPKEVVKQSAVVGGTNYNTISSTANSGLSYVSAVAQDGAGQTWVANTYGSSIDCFVPATDGSDTFVKSTLVNPLRAAFITGDFPGGAGGGFNIPQGVAVWGTPHLGAASGAIYVADYFNGMLKKYTYNTGTSMWIPTSYVMNIGFGASSFGVPGVQWGPAGLSITSDGATIYATDLLRHVVFKIATSTFTGNGVASSAATVVAGVLDTPGETVSSGAIKLREPRGVTVVSDGVWVADTLNSRILKIDLNTPANVLVNFKPTSSNLPAQFLNSGAAVALGPDSSAPTGYLILSGEQGNVRLFKLDANFNIVAISNTPYANSNLYTGVPPEGAAPGAWNLVRSFAVDDPSAPTRIYVAKDGYYRNNANEVGIEILNASTLETISRSSDSINATIGGCFSCQYIDGSVWVSANNAGIPSSQSFVATFTARLTVAGDVVGMGDNFFSTTYGDSYGYMSNMITYNFGGAIGNRKAFWQTITLSTAAGGTRAVRWSWNGSAWVRDGAVIALAGVLPLGVGQSSVDASVYIAFPYDNYVKRYGFTAASGSTYTFTANFGTGPSTSGGAKDQVTAPFGISVPADSARIAVVCHKSLEFASSDNARIVYLSTTASTWTGGNTPFLSDTNNTATIRLTGLKNPTGIAVSADGNSVYITDSARNVCWRMLRTFGTSNNSFMLSGAFGVPDESGTDHGHLSQPTSVVVASATRIIIGDTINSRIIGIHPSHAGVSNGSGDISTMSALGATDSLRIWYNTVAYQGVGVNLFPTNNYEWIYNNQLLALSDYIYSTTLGRAKITDSTMSQVAGAIERLPLAGKAAGYDSSSFAGGKVGLQALESLASLPLVRVPILNYGQSNTAGIGTSQGENAFTLVGRTSAQEPFVNRGFSPVYLGVYTAWPLKSPAPNRLNIMIALMKRGGQVFLMVITNIRSTTNVDVSVGKDTETAYLALDIFQVPGRLLAR